MDDAVQSRDDRAVRNQLKRVLVGVIGAVVVGWILLTPTATWLAVPALLGTVAALRWVPEEASSRGTVDEGAGDAADGATTGDVASWRK